MKPIGGVLFETKLIKIPTSVKDGEKVFMDAIKCLKGKEPKASDCEWCKLIK